jgi:O-antigen/teichoic acid export membrane protein
MTAPSDNGSPRPEQEEFWRSRGWWGRVGKTAIGSWIAGALSIVGTLIAARALGPADYGAVFLAISVVTSISILLDVTFEEATVFHGNRALASGDLGGLRSLLAISLRADIAIGVVVTTAIVALAAPLAEIASAGDFDPSLIRIVALSVVVTTADSTAYAALSLARRPDLRARGMAVTSAFRLLGVAVAVQVGGAEAVAASYVLGGAAGSVYLGRLAWRAAWREWRSASAPSPAPATTRELVRYAFHTSLTTTVQAVSGTLVPVLLARAAGPAAVGIFRVGMLPVIVAQNLSGPVRLAMFPEQARLVAEGRTAEIRRATRGYTLIAFGLGSVGAVVGWLAIPWLIPLLYGSQFDAAVTPARILLIAAVSRFALGWRKSMLAAIGRPEIRTRLVMVNFVVVISLMLLIADQGPEGAAIAVSSGTVASGLAWLFVAPRVLSDESLLAARAGRSAPGARKRARGPSAVPRQDPSGAVR